VIEPTLNELASSPAEPRPAAVCGGNAPASAALRLAADPGESVADPVTPTQARAGLNGPGPDPGAGAGTCWLSNDALTAMIAADGFIAGHRIRAARALADVDELLYALPATLRVNFRTGPHGAPVVVTPIADERLREKVNLRAPEIAAALKRAQAQLDAMGFLLDAVVEANNRADGKTEGASRE
jgi:hypothetical protein